MGGQRRMIEEDSRGEERRRIGGEQIKQRRGG